ncbi:MAG TPA: hypothetical protein VEQ12_10515 [Candidatus Limnocylindria bacterium]|nr:hypothetical protein [Candidatus Limnocylindria bacterium]
MRSLLGSLVQALTRFCCFLFGHVVRWLGLPVRQLHYRITPPGPARRLGLG